MLYFYMICLYFYFFIKFVFDLFFNVLDFDLDLVGKLMILV